MDSQVFNDFIHQLFAEPNLQAKSISTVEFKWVTQKKHEFTSEQNTQIYEKLMASELNDKPHILCLRGDAYYYGYGVEKNVDKSRNQGVKSVDIHISYGI